MKTMATVCLLLIILTSSSAFSQPEGPPEEMMKNAYQQLLAQTDTNKDGKISVSECEAIYKDPEMAQKTCKFWDANNDGVITEEEYIKQIKNIGRGL